MSTDNKSFVEGVFRQWEETGNPEPLVEALRDDLCWIVSGTSPISGTYRSKQEWQEKVMAPLHDMLATPIQCKLVQVIAEGSDVVVLWRGDATSKRGMSYAQEYCWILNVEDRQIKSVKGFFDTRLVTELLRNG